MPPGAVLDARGRAPRTGTGHRGATRGTRRPALRSERVMADTIAIRTSSQAGSTAEAAGADRSAVAVRKMLRGKIHRATVTEANLNYEGSITVDTTLMRAMDLIEFESVNVWDVSNGERFETYVLEGPADSGVVCVNGA